MAKELCNQNSDHDRETIEELDPENKETRNEIHVEKIKITGTVSEKTLQKIGLRTSGEKGYKMDSDGKSYFEVQRGKKTTRIGLTDSDINQGFYLEIPSVKEGEEIELDAATVDKMVDDIMRKRNIRDSRVAAITDAAQKKVSAIRKKYL